MGFKPWSEDRVAQEQPVGVWTRTEVLSQPTTPASVPCSFALVSSLFRVYLNCHDVRLKEGAENVAVVTQAAARQLQESPRRQRKPVGFLG